MKVMRSCFADLDAASDYQLFFLPLLLRHRLRLCLLFTCVPFPVQAVSVNLISFSLSAFIIFFFAKSNQRVVSFHGNNIYLVL